MELPSGKSMKGSSDYIISIFRYICCLWLSSQATEETDAVLGPGKVSQMGVHSCRVIDVKCSDLVELEFGHQRYCPKGKKISPYVLMVDE